MHESFYFISFFLNIKKNENIKCENDRTSLLKVYKRAVRNSPWSGTLWIKYALCLEYNSSSATEIKSKQIHFIATFVLILLRFYSF